MKRVVVALMSASVAFACAPKASPEDCSAACTTQAELNRAPDAKDAGAADVEKPFAEQMAAAQREHDEAVAAATEAAAPKLKKAKGKAKAKLTKELDDMKASKAEELKTKLASINQAKADALAKAAAEKSKAQAAAKAAADKAIAECAEACIQEGRSQALAVCQGAAADLEAFNACATK